MHDVASIIAFKRKQIASLAENGSDAAKAAIARLNADIAKLDASSPEGVAAEAAKPIDPAAVPQTVVDELRAKLVSVDAQLADLRGRLGVVEVLTAPAPQA